MNAILDRQDIRVEALRIGGEKVHTPRTIAVRNPYTGETVGTVAMATLEDVRRAYEIAHAYVPRLSRYERSAILNRAALLLRARTDEASTLITSESGLSKKDSIYEIGRVADVLNFGANEALRDDGQVFSCDLTPHGKQRKVITTREPLLGVITAITPFNHPMNQVAHKVVPSVATNNRMVLKPSEKVPLSALYFADLLYEAGLPPEMLQVITGDPREIADEMLTHRHVELITFTGGVEIGKYIANKAGYRRIVLELGGNDPLIVMDDADLDRASDLAVQGSYKNSGQRCTAVKRMLVHEKVAAEFTERVVAKTRAWKFGDPMDAGNDMGTVIDEAAARRFQAVVEEAVAQGARLLAGNEREGALYAPTVLDRVRPEMTVVREETFGPVSPILRFANIDEAIVMSNGTAFGLSSGICTNRMDDVMRFAKELKVGTVNLWEVPGYRIELTPFGGIKDSGLGYKEGVQEAIKSFTNCKTLSLPW
ncbi:phosphonoacetaldehyde dehydrogenase [Variovorax paradoxus]|jgi:putative phosphonoacetaldehyde dehydrogenase|uniref:phosphonoacetaldehyde dehydrogenase n=1 Tax=Variovorax paradoxus TaxID=34073 RepID=UPI0006E540D3|nr:phosphonoacetaldehyde dehydrogenase [Variovorax paradoxus]KPU97276.1 phosphonoacetaldehyde dehydrogenase [Variovorax paradoxus]KPV13534.1 phosphonoacetaldehyde dehydrogenase [Variovorax paradoxus]KPV15333.1 phosphonoacetaldehyde dehydrogenase [Variovorax paradoxus]KPV32783.1 phosphonoacetaldehyde dehydrogenase [Variovorax paradoxus]